MKRNSSILKAVLAAVVLGVGSSSAVLAQTTSSAGSSSPQVTASHAALSPAANEVVKMYRSGISKDVMAGYIRNNMSECRLSADDILYLNSIGFPGELVTAMMQRDAELQRPSAVLPTPAPSVVVPTSPAPDVTVVPDYSDSSYYYPYYGYYDYAPPVVIGGWGGWGWHGGWGHGWDGGHPIGGFHGGGVIHGGGGFHGGGGGAHGGGHR